MAEVNLRIERLRVRLRGVSQRDARTFADRLPEAIAAHLAPTVPRRTALRVDLRSLDLGSLTLPGSPTVSGIRAIAASSIGRALNERLASAQEESS